MMSIDAIDARDGPVELRHLRYFLKTADEPSFTRATEALRVTQSTLSHRIRQLEREVGPLFGRVGRAIQPTSRGRIFRPHAERILGELRTSLPALDDLDQLVTGRLTVGAYRAFDASPLPVRADFRRDHQGAKMRVHIGDHLELAHRLIAGAIDVAIGYAPVVSEKIAAERLFVEPLALIVGDAHTFHGRSEVGVERLQDVPLVAVSFENRQRQLVHRALAGKGIHPRVVVETSSNEAVRALVRCSAHAAICPPVERPGLRSLRIAGLPHKRTIVMLWRRDGHRSSAAPAIVPRIKAAYAARRT